MKTNKRDKNLCEAIYSSLLYINKHIYWF